MSENFALEMKNTMDGIKSISDTEEGNSSELGDVAVEITQN